MSHAARRGPRAAGAPRPERCVSWFSAVVLFVLLSATGDAASAVTSVAQNRVEIRSERHKCEAATLPGHLQTVPCRESVARSGLPCLPWSRSVTEYGLPLPRAPTA